MKVLFVLGSFREQSFNKTLASYIDEKVSQKVETRFLEYKDLPFINQDEEFPAPKEVARVREEVQWADVVWIVTPEYNGFFPGSVKNLLDWLSRPVAADQNPLEFIANKPVIVSAAAFAPASDRVIAQLKTLLSNIQMAVFEPTAAIALTPETVGTGVLELSEEQKAVVDNQIEKFFAEFVK